MPRSVSLHFTLELKVLKRPRKFEWMKTLHGMQIMFHFYQILHPAHLEEVGLTQNWETMTVHNLKTLDFIRSAHMSRMVLK